MRCEEPGCVGWILDGRCTFCGRVGGESRSGSPADGRPRAVEALGPPAWLAAAGNWMRRRLADVWSPLVEVRGRILASYGPAHEPAGFDPWKWLAILEATLAAIPFAALGLLAVVGWRLLLALLGIRRVHRRRVPCQRDSLYEIVIRHLLGRILLPAPPLPVYHHVLESPGGRIQARQPGEFRGGRMIATHEVQLIGHWRRGVLELRKGRDLTTGAYFFVRRSPWRPWCLVLLVLIILELMYLGRLVGCVPGGMS